MPEITVTEPTETAFSHNPIILTVQSEVLSAGGKASKVLTLPLLVPALSPASLNPCSIRFGQNGTDTVFLAGDVPSSDTFDRNNAPESFANLFNNTPSLNYKYTAYLAPGTDAEGNYRVTIVAGKSGSAYNFTLACDGFPHNVAAVTAGSDATRGQSKPEYGILCEVYAGKTGNFNDGATDNPAELVKVATLQRNYSEDNTYRFDIAPSLRPYLSTHLPPDAGQTIPVVVTDMNVAYHVRVSEQYAIQSGGFRSQYFREQTQLKKAVLGALPLTDANSTDAWRNFSTGPVEPLTQRLPDGKPVYTGQAEWLAWLLDMSMQDTGAGGPFAFQTTRIQATVTRIDGTSYNVLRPGPGGSAGLPLTGILAERGGIHYQRTDLAALGITADTDIASWQVTAFVGTRQITKPVTYRPFQTLEPPRTLCWLNALNAYETFTFGGEQQYSLTRNESRITGTLPLAPLPSNHYARSRTVETADTVRIFTHPLDKDTFLYLRSLLASPLVFLMVANGSGFLYQSVVVDGFDYVFDSRTTLYSVSVSVTDSIPENNLTL